jgi:hypothetical protein
MPLDIFQLNRLDERWLLFFKGLSSSMAQVRFAFRNLSIFPDIVKILTTSRRLAYWAHANPINRENGKPVGKRFGIKPPLRSTE